MAKLMLVQKTTAGSVTLDDIPAEFKAEFEQVYADLRDNPTTELRVEFEDAAERKQWLKFAKSYGEQRMDPKTGDAAPLKVRATPKRNLPETTAYIAITHDAEAAGAKNTHK